MDRYSVMGFFPDLVFVNDYQGAVQDQKQYCSRVYDGDVFTDQNRPLFMSFCTCQAGATHFHDGGIHPVDNTLVR
jgi:hypothetical protein